MLHLHVTLLLETIIYVAGSTFPSCFTPCSKRKRRLLTTKVPDISEKMLVQESVSYHKGCVFLLLEQIHILLCLIAVLLLKRQIMCCLFPYRTVDISISAGQAGKTVQLYTLY